jgi:hypothetical protein
VRAGEAERTLSALRYRVAKPIGEQTSRKKMEDVVAPSTVSGSTGPSLVDLQKQLLKDEKKLVTDTTSKADQKIIASDELQVKMDEALIEAAEAQAAMQAQLAVMRDAATTTLMPATKATVVASGTPVSKDPTAVYL